MMQTVIRKEEMRELLVDLATRVGRVEILIQKIMKVQEEEVARV